MARQTLGTGLSAAALSGLTDELQRRWNPNCDVEGGRDVQVRVVFTLGAGGQVVGDVTPQTKGAATPVARIAAERAVSAVFAASPFRNLPREFYGDKIAVNFNLIHAIQALAESETLVESYGIDSSTFVEILTDVAFTGSAYQGYGKLIAEQDYTAAVASYRQTVLTAMEEVENGITGLASLDQAARDVEDESAEDLREKGRALRARLQSNA